MQRKRNYFIQLEKKGEHHEHSALGENSFERPLDGHTAHHIGRAGEVCAAVPIWILLQRFQHKHEVQKLHGQQQHAGGRLTRRHRHSHIHERNIQQHAH